MSSSSIGSINGGTLVTMAPVAYGAQSQPRVMPSGNDSTAEMLIPLACVSLGLLGAGAYLSFRQAPDAKPLISGDLPQSISDSKEATVETGTVWSSDEPEISKKPELWHEADENYLYHERQCPGLCGKHSANAALHLLSFPLMTEQFFRDTLDPVRREISGHPNIGTGTFCDAEELSKILQAHAAETENFSIEAQPKYISLTDDDLTNKRAILILTNRSKHWVSILRDKQGKWRIVNSSDRDSQEQRFDTFQEAKQAFCGTDPGDLHYVTIEKRPP